MPRKPEQPLDELQGKRQRTLELAALQREMRAALTLHKKHSGLTMDGLARELSRRSNDISEFLEGSHAICGGQILNAVTRIIKRDDLRSHILKTASGLSDRARGLASFSTEVINLLFDLQETHRKDASEVPFRQFARCFAPHEETVARSITSDLKAIQKLEDPAVRGSIATLLSSGEWRSKLNSTGIPPDTVERFVRATSSLQEILTGWRNVARALNIGETTLHNARKGDVAEKSMDLLLRSAERLLTTKAEHTTSPDRSIIERLGGETSPLGVPYVIGKNSFKSIAGDPGKEGIAFTRRSIAVTRAMLNVLAQLEDPSLREHIRTELGAEVEELDLAIRLFTAKYPNRLTQLHDDQRATWLKTTSPDPKRKGGR